MTQNCQNATKCIFPVVLITLFFLAGCQQLTTGWENMFPSKISLSATPASTDSASLKSVKIPTERIQNAEAKVPPVKPKNFSDITIIQPAKNYLESAESKSVAVISQEQAAALKCSNMQRYKVRTNVDFTSTMHLLRYRSSLMGANKIAIIYHGELDDSEGAATADTTEVHIREGSTISGSKIHSTLVGDLYDCPAR